MNVAAPVEPDAAALALRDVEIVYRVRGRDREVLRGVTLTIEKQGSYGLVGESGCGKSTAALSIVRYLPRNGRVTRGSIQVAGRDVLKLRGESLRRYRRDAVSMVYQNPGSALNPALRVGRQVAEVFALRGADRSGARERSLAVLREVNIADPVSVLRRYPHQLSGGMQQRVIIAMALATNPELLILDEPTTGLDATVEAEVLDLIGELQERFSTAVLFISHNLAVIRKTCERVGVLYAGELVEEGPTEEILQNPSHPYTVGLLRCIPRGGLRKDRGKLDTIPGFLPPIGVDLPACVYVHRCALAEEICRVEKPADYRVGETHISRCHFHDRAQELPRATDPTPAPGVGIDRLAIPLLRVDHLTKTFNQDGHEIKALAGVSAVLWPGETLGLVGESGSGKTTFARTLLGLVEPTAGTVEIDGNLMPPKLGERSAADVAALQIVFQNPDSALNRRHTVRRMLKRTLGKLAHVGGGDAERRAQELVESVRLPERALSSRPTGLSGGQKQRVAIARAFAGNPRLVVCDEPTSALDVSVQAAILNLLVDLQTSNRTSYVFISHDLGVVSYLSDRIAVLYLGRLMELGPAETVFSPPHHPYTEALLSAVPTIEGEQRTRIDLEGDIPSAADPPTGCVFHTRCPRFLGEVCVEQEPPLAEVEPEHFIRCHIPIDELRLIQKTAPPAERVPVELPG
ncbi:MAG: ABC transporter ATP-binding protein [Actinobacteria bacterium]|nr:ABC transporter ATP-binding protein [Actinomycetota bacterium]